MMEQRLTWILIGCGIGFIAGYIVRLLQEVLRKTTEIDDILKRSETEDAGFIRTRLATNIGLFLVVALTAWAAFSSQKASNAVTDQQDRQKHIADCTLSYQIKTLAALNARTTYAQEQGAANYDLQKSQSEFLLIFVQKPKATPAQGLKAFEKYLGSLTKYLEVARSNNQAVSDNPFPTVEELTNCLRGN